MALGRYHAVGLRLADQLLLLFLVGGTLAERADQLLLQLRRQELDRAGQPASLQGAEQALSRLTNRLAGALPAIQHLPEATLLRIEYDGDRREIYSLLRNRAHSNVAFMYGESLRWQPRLDTLTVYPGVLSSYPNFLFNVPAAEVPAFVAALEEVRASDQLERLVDRWGVRRSHPRFWDYFNDLTRYLEETEPLEAGVLDMNRYENL